MTALPTGIVPFDTGHISHHNTIHALLNPVDAPFGVTPFAAGSLAALPAPGQAGRLWVPDEVQGVLVDDGTEWRSVGGDGLAPTYYVNPDFARADDTNSGLSEGDCLETIAAALALIGGGADNTNVATIVLGEAEFGSAVAGLAQLEVKGVSRFRIRGKGVGRTMLWGPDAAALFRMTNTFQCIIQDLSYMGSPSEDGWGIEFQADWTGLAFVGGVPAASNYVKRVNFGRYTTGDQSSFYGADHAGAFGIRFSLKGGSTVNDANNDQSTLEDCSFFGIDQPISIEHLNSLWHKIIRPHMVSCAGGVKLQGGSATVYDPVVGGLGTGWAFELEDPVSSIAVPVYTHKALEVYNVRGEGTEQGLVRSSVGAGATSPGSISQCHAEFYGGSWKAGPEGGINGDVVSWAAESGDDSGPTRLDFFGGHWGSWFGGTTRIHAPSTSSIVTFNGGEVHVAEFEWGGQLHFNEVSAPVGAFTLTPGLVYSERNCSGGGFVGVTPIPTRQLIGPYTQDLVPGSQLNVLQLLGGDANRVNANTARAGFVTALTIESSANITGGTVTVEVLKEGLATGLTAVLDVGNPAKRVTVQGLVDAFAATDNIAVRCTTVGMTAGFGVYLTSFVELTYV